ncbi:MAG: YicC family protein [Gammaproteobacteria bacterium]|nr:YicC family protein [Gammaproteobacteria bacterium]MYF37303.1 YicC family protein [Gammaproteobacteria bacterium]
MTCSMTAFARIQEPSYAWEIRSVNHRGLEIRLKLPEAIRELETNIKEQTRQALTRGYVEIFFHEQPPDQIAPKEAHEIDPALLQAITDLSNALPTKKMVSVVDVTRLLQNPNLLPTRPVKPVYDLDELVLTFQACLKQLLNTRQQEGQALRSVVLESVETARSLLIQIDDLGKEQPKLIQERLTEKLRSLEKHVDPNRVAQEVALLAQKADFKEEQDRLNIHLVDVEKCLNVEAPVGRRLNFLAQEILREANTLAVKAQLPACASLVIDLKVCVDQMREQIQNIE